LYAPMLGGWFLRVWLFWHLLIILRNFLFPAGVGLPPGFCHVWNSAHGLTSVLGRLCSRRLCVGLCSGRTSIYRAVLPVADRPFPTVPFRHCTNFLHSPVQRSVLRPDIVITTDGKGNVVSIRN